LNLPIFNVTVNAMRGNTEKGFVKLLTTCVIVLIVLILVVGAVAFFVLKKGISSFSQFKPKTGEERISDKANTNRVTGNAGEFFPYGDIKEDTIVSDLIGSEGGVLTAQLSSGVKVYLIVPPNYSGIGGDVYKLTPYFSMPTSKNAPALPTDLGYGRILEV